MKRVLKFNNKQPLPMVIAKLFRNDEERLVRLVFDTGAAMTQFSTGVIDALGYSARDGISRISAHGPSGPLDEGFALHLDSLEVFGRRFNKPLVAAYDFDNLEAAQIDGLLGFDIIKQLHIEMNGPKGELVVFDN
jgi:hypothetical protein